MICARCVEEITGGVDCLHWHEIDYPDGHRLLAVPYDGVERCPDCGTRALHVHHEHCDQEACPRCRSQLISCGCFETEHEGVHANA
jgi:hypothetical protein